MPLSLPTSCLNSKSSSRRFDIESAYRLIPVHLDDRPLLGMVWKGKLYVDTTLPFGLKSAPKLFSVVADALQWIMEQNRVPGLLQYLDDFLVLGAPDSPERRQALEQPLWLCELLGVPVAMLKTEGPATVIVFLGIELDTVARILRLPKKKLHRLQTEIGKWTGWHSCTKRELLSLIGQLQHACCVVNPYLGKTSSDLSPVMALLNYLVLRWSPFDPSAPMLKEYEDASGHIAMCQYLVSNDTDFSTQYHHPGTVYRQYQYLVLGIGQHYLMMLKYECESHTLGGWWSVVGGWWLVVGG